MAVWNYGGPPPQKKTYDLIVKLGHCRGLTFIHPYDQSQDAAAPLSPLVLTSISLHQWLPAGLKADSHPTLSFTFLLT